MDLISNFFRSFFLSFFLNQCFTFHIDRENNTQTNKLILWPRYHMTFFDVSVQTQRNINMVVRKMMICHLKVDFIGSEPKDYWTGCCDFRPEN